MATPSVAASASWLVKRRTLMPAAASAPSFYEGRDFPLLQILWPDKAGRFPGERGFDAGLAKVQPVLP